MQILPLRYAQGQDDSALGQLIARRMCDLGRESRPGESHPEALAEPDVTLSRHTAPIKEPPRIEVQCANSCGERRETAATHCRARRTCLRSFLYFCLAQLTSS